MADEGSLFPRDGAAKDVGSSSVKDESDDTALALSDDNLQALMAKGHLRHHVSGRPNLTRLSTRTRSPNVPTCAPSSSASASSTKKRREVGISNLELLDIAKKILPQWMRPLGLALGFIPGEVERHVAHMKMTLPGSDAIYQMLVDWNERGLHSRKELNDIIATVLAENFQATPTGPVVEADLDVDTFREELERFYFEDYCYVKTDPWDDTEFLLDRYFTYLSLNEEGSGDLKKIPLVNSHNGIFEVKIDDRIPSRILVFGEGGSGKTTLCKKLAYDWAKRNPESPLKDVPILCALELRKLLGPETIEYAIHSQLLCRDSEITPEQIKRFIRSNPSKIVIVLDGYDEFNPKSKGDIKDMLNSKIMAKVRVMVTTRPWPSCVLQQNKHKYAQINLEGFDSQGIETYIRNYFVEESLANESLEQIRANGTIYALASTPIVLSMVCFVIKISSEDIAQIDTMSKMFESFLRALFIKFIDKHNFDEEASYTEPSHENELKSKLRDFWKGLGKMALSSLEYDGLKIFFNEDEFCDDSVRTLGLQVGLLVRHKSKLTRMDALESPMTFYSFPHLMFQEKCAGDYLARNSGEFDSFMTDIQSAERAFELQYILAFACGKEPKEMNVYYPQQVMDRLLHIKTCDWSPIRQPIKKNTTDDLSDRLTKGVEDYRSSLFNVALFINYESQSEMLHLDTMRGIIGYNLYHQVVDGIHCTHFLYFLDFAISAGVSLPPCLSITLCESSKPVNLKTYAMRVMTVFSDVARIGVNRCRIEYDDTDYFLESRRDTSLAAHTGNANSAMPLLGTNDHISGKPNPKEILLSGIPHSVVLADLAKSASTITPKVSQIILKSLEIEMPKSDTSQSQSFNAMPSLERLVLDNIKTPVSLEQSMYLTSLCPNLSSFELYSCKVDNCQSVSEVTFERFPKVMILNNLKHKISGSELLNLLTYRPGVQCLKLEQCRLSLQSSIKAGDDSSEVLTIEDVFLKNTGTAIQLSDVVQLFRFYCKNLSLTYTRESIEGTIGPGEFLCNQDYGMCVIETLAVISRGDPISLPGLIMVTNVLLPNLKRLYLEGNIANSSALPDVIYETMASLTVVHFRSVSELVSMSVVLTLMKVCSELRKLVVDACHITGSNQGLELSGCDMQHILSKDITLVFEKIPNTLSVCDIVGPVRKSGFKSVAFCFSKCIIDVTYGSEKHISIDGCELGVSFEDCTTSDSSTTIQEYMKATWPSMRMTVHEAKRTIFFTSTFNVQRCKLPLEVLLGKSLNWKDDTFEKAETDVDTISNFHHRSSLHFMHANEKK